ncbi:MAG: hypothetical protein ACI9MC_001554 [Kiritimatiellia bacterium]|jgi:hypothetical protein
MFLSDPSIHALKAAAAAIDLRDGEGLLVLLAEQSQPDLTLMVEALRSLDVPFFGGSFPAVVVHGRRHDEGAVLLAVPLLGSPLLIDDMAEGVPGLLERWPDLFDRPGVRPTAFVFVDGLADKIGSLLHSIYAQLGATVTYIGAGAGNLRFEPAPCVFTQDGVARSGAVLAMSPTACAVAVRHGWTRMVGPMVATRTTGNRVHELNWRPAFEVYQQAVRAVNPKDFFNVAKGHPFGIRKEGQEDLVRDPIDMDESGTIVCIGDVPQNAVLWVLQGAPPSLIHAAAHAAREAFIEATGTHRASLIIDCISRASFLQDHFDDELKAIDQVFRRDPKHVRPEGVLTLGEIGSRGDGLLELFTKTAVVGVLHEPE